ncbi:MAG: tol-pal system protein YbgF [Pseudomonadales bacterium]|nr:tol-pal system protein YbgF [Pseudomonadales bacterium]
MRRVQHAASAYVRRPVLAGVALAALVFGLLPVAAAGVPVEESVGVTRDGSARAATAPVRPSGLPASASTQPFGSPAQGGIAQGNPWHGGADPRTAGGLQSGGESSAPMVAAIGTATTQRVTPASAATGPSSQTSELFYQIQLLQQEVQELRGLVEELTHEVNRLARDQQTQYRDLDGRLVALRGGAVSGAPAPVGGGAPPAPGAGAGAAPGPGGPAAPGAEPVPGQGAAPGEREAYSSAFEQMRQRRFPESTAAFNRFIADYPNSAFTSNAFYWLGELYLAQDDLERARQSFTQVLNLYPDSQKVPDSLYKLGVVQHRLGDVGRAREFLNRAVSQYPGSSAAALAQTYLSELR